ncbi:MAG: SusC/RagA family TonB-linked outer membrane protein, partial [Tannerella sp.]|nr:SusC/RagA family TonB-linked outer membrane protein [Tannerella sp.]
FNWNESFGLHNVGLMTVGVAEEKNLTNGANGTIYETLPERNLGNSSRFTYDYDSRYFLEASYGYNGSEKFDKSHRFGFFPAFGLGWMISNEPYYSDKMKEIFQLLKLKFTYGKVGNDAIAGRSGRFFFLSEISSGGGSYRWGTDFLNEHSGYSVIRYNNPNIQWEVSSIANLGLELGLLNGMTLQVDLFNNIRDKIYWPRNNIPQTMGYETTISGNVGKVESQGFDGSLDYKHSFNASTWLTARANLSFSKNKIVQTDEPAYDEPYLYTVGRPVNQAWGYVAERLFVDQAEIENSPSQSFGEYMRGDIKYSDVNGDGVINSNDRIPIGYPTVPQIQYGFGASTGYKEIDFSFFFQGNAQTSFFIAPASIAPLVDRRNAPAIIARDSWSETNPDIHAFWPRLAVYQVNNNLQNSTWWLREGGFLRLKTLEIGYSPAVLKKLGVTGGGRIYLSGENLFYFSSFKLWDPEMGGNGLRYPINRRFNLGLQVMF